MARLKIIRTRGEVGRTEKQRATLRHLGLRKINASVVRDDSPETRGMLAKVNHLVTIEEVE